MKTPSRFIPLAALLAMALAWSVAALAWPVTAQEATPTPPDAPDCPYPDGYLDDMLADLQSMSERIGAVDTNEPADISLTYVSVYQLRHRYENMIPNLPNCAMRGHALFTNILSNWEDILGLALATYANPDAAQEYIAEIEVINDRIEFFTPLLLAENFPPRPPTPGPPTPTQPPILSTFRVNEGGLTVRTGPGPDFDAIGFLEEGSPIDVIALDTLDNGDVWYEILYPDSDDGTGWVFGGLINTEPDEE